jgi:hypothetical protein
MKTQYTPPQKNSFEGLAFGFLGVLGFSFTLPATRMSNDPSYCLQQRNSKMHGMLISTTS